MNTSRFKAKCLELSPTTSSTQSPLVCPHQLLNLISSQICQSKLHPSSFYYNKVLSLLNSYNHGKESISNANISIPNSNRNAKEPLSSAAKRRIRRKRNQMKRLDEILITTAAATAASILNSKDDHLSESRQHCENKAADQLLKSNPFKCNHSNNDHFYNHYNASSYKIKSCLRYVLLFYQYCLVFV